MNPFDVEVEPLVNAEEEQRKARELKLAQAYSKERNPDSMARAVQLAGQAGMTVPAAAAAEPPKFDWALLQKTSPVLAKFLVADLNRAAAVGDDAEHLSGIEAWFKGWDDLAHLASDSADRTKRQTDMNNLGWKWANGGLTAEERLRLAKLEAEDAANPAPKAGYIPGIVPATTQALGQQVNAFSRHSDKILQAGVVGAATKAAMGAAAGPVGAGAGAFTGFLAGSAAGLAGASMYENGVLEGGGAFLEYVKIPGVTEEQAAAAARTVALLNGGLEAIELGPVMGLIPGAKALMGGGAKKAIGTILRSQTGRAAFARFMGRIGTVGIAEAFQEAAQEFVTIYEGHAVQEVGAGEALARTFSPGGMERMGESTIGGFQMAFGMGSVNVGVRTKVDLAEVAQSKRRVELMEALSDISENSKTRERLPEALQEYVAKVQEQHGGAPESVSVPAGQLRQVFQVEGKDEAWVEEKLPLVAKQLREAGEDPAVEVSIPLPEFAAHVAGLKSTRTLYQDLRVGEGMTVRESEAAQKRSEDIPGEVEEQAELPEEKKAPVVRVYESVQKMARSLGMNPEDSKKNAILWASSMEARAARRAKDPSGKWKDDDAWSYFQTVGLQVEHTELDKAQLDAFDAARTEKTKKRRPRQDPEKALKDGPDATGGGWYGKAVELLRGRTTISTRKLQASLGIRSDEAQEIMARLEKEGLVAGQVEGKPRAVNVEALTSAERAADQAEQPAGSPPAEGSPPAAPAAPAEEEGEGGIFDADAGKWVGELAPEAPAAPAKPYQAKEAEPETPAEKAAREALPTLGLTGETERRIEQQKAENRERQLSRPEHVSPGEWKIPPELEDRYIEVSNAADLVSGWADELAEQSKDEKGKLVGTGKEALASIADDYHEEIFQAAALLGLEHDLAELEQDAEDGKPLDQDEVHDRFWHSKEELLQLARELEGHAQAATAEAAAETLPARFDTVKVLTPEEAQAVQEGAPVPAGEVFVDAAEGAAVAEATGGVAVSVSTVPGDVVGITEGKLQVKELPGSRVLAEVSPVAQEAAVPTSGIVTPEAAPFVGIKFSRQPVWESVNTKEKVRAAQKAVEADKERAAGELPVVGKPARFQSAEERLAYYKARGEAWELEERKTTARKWREARARLRSLDPRKRAAFVDVWNKGGYPKTPAYLLDLLRNPPSAVKEAWKKIDEEDGLKARNPYEPDQAQIDAFNAWALAQKGRIKIEWVKSTFKPKKDNHYGKRIERTEWTATVGPMRLHLEPSWLSIEPDGSVKRPHDARVGTWWGRLEGGPKHTLFDIGTDDGIDEAKQGARDAIERWVKEAKAAAKEEAPVAPAAPAADPTKGDTKENPIRVALVACGTAKKPGKHKARELYTSDLFKKSLALAEATNDQVYILSGKHRLVDLDTELESYDQKLDTKNDPMWGTVVRNDLTASRGLANKFVHVTLYAGENYASEIAAFPDTWTVEKPLEGKQIGERLSWLKQQLDGLAAPAAEAPVVKAGKAKVKKPKTKKDAALQKANAAAEAVERAKSAKEKEAALKAMEAAADELEQAAAEEEAAASAPMLAEESVQGTEGMLITPAHPNGERVVYAVVDAASVIPSHDPVNFQPSEAYPAGVQERLYHSDDAERVKVARGAQALNPALMLTDDPSALNGPPIVTAAGKDGKHLVMGGNGRSMMLKRAALEHPESFKGYLDALRARAPQYGIPANAFEDMKAPVLVRIMPGLRPTSEKGELVAAVRRTNEGMTQALSATAKAVAEAKALSDEALEWFAEKLASVDGTLRDVLRNHNGDVRDVLKRSGVITDQNISAWVEKGWLTNEAKDRIEGMFLGRILGSGDRLTRTTELNKAVLQKLERIVPHLVRVEGINPDLSEIPTVQAAVDLLNDAKGAGNTLAEQLAQQPMFGGTPPAVVAMAKLIDGSGQKELAAKFKVWANQAAKDPSQGTMFGDSPVDARKELLGQEGTTRTLMQKVERKQPGLVVQHNLTADNLVFADQLGGLPVPSLAIAKGEHPLKGFGEITLLGPKELVDPAAGVPVFDADVYSPRFPNTRFKVDNKKAWKFAAWFRPYAKAVNAYTSDLENELGKDGPEGLMRRGDWMAAMTLAYLAERGEVVEPKMRKVPLQEGTYSAQPAMQEFLAKHGRDINFDFGGEYHKALSEAAKAALRQHWEEVGKALGHDADEVERDIKRGLERDFNDDGTMHFSTAHVVLRDLLSLGKQEIDTRATEDALLDRARGIEAEVRAYGLEKLGQLTKGKFIAKWSGGESPGWRLSPLTMENVVREMTRAIKAEEQGFLSGPGRARAKGARRFRSIEAIKAAEGRIVDEAGFESAKNAWEQRFGDIAAQLRHFHPAGNDFGFLDTLIDALGESFKRGHYLYRELALSGFKNVPGELVTELGAVGAAMRELPTEYFEAKPQRVVGLDEFKAAVIPWDADPKVRAILERHGLKVYEYGLGEESEGRTRASLLSDERLNLEDARAWTIEQASKTERILFQTSHHGTGHPDPIAQLSTQFIGSGQGAATYGWGIYSAETLEVADEYFRELSRPGEGRTGHVYQVTVPDKEFLLDWDKALSNQPAFIKEKLGFPKTSSSDGSPMALVEASVHHYSGEQFYKLLAEELSDSGKALVDMSREEKVEAYRKASMWLKSVGIDGLKYQDQKSRSLSGTYRARELRGGVWEVVHKYGGRMNSFNTEAEAQQEAARLNEGTHNFVVWNDDAMRVERMLYQRKSANLPPALVVDLKAAGSQEAILQAIVRQEVKIHQVEASGVNVAIPVVPGMNRSIAQFWSDVTEQLNVLGPGRWVAAVAPEHLVEVMRSAKPARVYILGVRPGSKQYLELAKQARAIDPGVELVTSRMDDSRQGSMFAPAPAAPAPAAAEEAPKASGPQMALFQGTNSVTLWQGRKGISPQDAEVAMATSRAGGAVGAYALVPRIAAEELDPTKALLDFGAGKTALHAARLRDAGFQVTAYDLWNVPGVHDPRALTRKYPQVIASNVLNVQASRPALAFTLDQLRDSMDPDGRGIFNLPATPRKGAFEGLTTAQGADMVELELKARFAKVEREGGATPVFRVSNPIEARKRAIPAYGQIDLFAPASALEGEDPALLQRKEPGSPEDYRGKTNFDEAANTWFRITLTGKANLSTFLHESGHVFLQLTRRDAELGHEQSKKDLAVLEEWAGVEPGGKWSDEALEKFARGFEAYLREGNAPSSALAEAFAAFKAWLEYLYRTVAVLDVELTDEVRQVMDRMVATDEAISTAAQNEALLPLFKETKGESGTTGQEYEAIRKLYNAAQEEAHAELLRDSLRELKRHVSEEAAAVRELVEKELDARPDYNAWSWFTTGKLLSGEPPAGLPAGKLDLEAVKNLGLGARAERKLKAVMAVNGLDPEAVAGLLGYETGDALVRALADLPARGGLATAMVTARMQDKYPGYTGSKSWFAEEADKKLTNKKLTAAVAAEIGLLHRKVGGEDARTLAEAIRIAAAKRIAGMTVMELSPFRLRKAAATAAVEKQRAWAEGNFAGAAQAARRQLWYLELARQAQTAKDEVEKVRSYLDRFGHVNVRRRIGKSSQVILAAIDKYLEGAEFKRRSDATLDRRESLGEYLADLADEGVMLSIPQELRDETKLKNYRQMTVGELRGLKAAVANLEAQASLKGKLLLKGEKRDLEKLAAQLSEQIRSLVGTRFAEKPGDNQNPDWWEKKLGRVRTARAHLTKIEFVCRVLDGGKTAGFFHQNVFQPLRDAAAEKFTMSEEMSKRLLAPFKALTVQERLRLLQRVDFLGTNMTLSDVLAVALNVGNESNLEKLVEGYAYRGWTREAVLDRLDQLLNGKDWQLVQHVWDSIDTLWPHIAALTERNIGEAPPRVEAREVVTRWGKFRGGYFPVVYDRQKLRKLVQEGKVKPAGGKDGAQIHDAGEAWLGNNFLLPYVSKGFTEARTKYAAPILLSLDLVPAHVNEVIHYLTHFEAVRAVDKLTQHQEVKTAIVEAIGQEMFHQFRPWLQDIARDGSMHAVQDHVDSILRWLRLGSSIVLLGMKWTVGLMQTLGLSPTMKELGVGWTMAGAKEFGARLADGNPFKEAEEQSAEQRRLVKHFDREIGDFFDTTVGLTGFGRQAQRGVAEFSLALIIQMQRTVNAITWYGARAKAIEEGHANPVAYADSVVAMTQSSSGMKDMAAIQRGPETKKLFTVMYTYYSVAFNQLSEGQGDKPTGTKLAVMASRWWWIVMLPVLLETFARGKSPEPEDEEKLWKLILRENILYSARTIPMAGAAADAMLGRFSTRNAPWLDTAYRACEAAGDGLLPGRHMTAGDHKAIADFLGMVLHIPTGGIANGIRYVNEYPNMEKPFQDLFLRSPRNWE